MLPVIRSNRCVVGIFAFSTQPKNLPKHHSYSSVKVAGETRAQQCEQHRRQRNDRRLVRQRFVRFTQLTSVLCVSVQQNDDRRLGLRRESSHTDVNDNLKRPICQLTLSLTHSLSARRQCAVRPASLWCAWRYIAGVRTSCVVVLTVFL